MHGTRRGPFDFEININDGVADLDVSARSLMSRSELKTKEANDMLLMIKTQLILLGLLGLWMDLVHRPLL
jgi:hypothetical protein